MTEYYVKKLDKILNLSFITEKDMNKFDIICDILYQQEPELANKYNLDMLAKVQLLFVNSLIK